MLELAGSIDSVTHVIQVALTPVFLLSGIASLLGVLSTRLARVADRVDDLATQIDQAGAVDQARLLRRLEFLRRRSRILDVAVISGALGGIATAVAALLLFVGTLRDRPGISLFIAFGLALTFTIVALTAFLFEMLLASRGIRDQAWGASESAEAPEVHHVGPGHESSSAGDGMSAA